MADAQRGDDFPEDDEGGGESTVSMASPTLDPAMPLPISVPPPPMPAAGSPPAMPNLSMPTAPTGFTPQAPPAFPMSGSGQRPPTAPGPSVPTPFGGVTPAGSKPATPATPAAPAREPVMSGQATGAAGAPAGMKRPQTVIGLAPPPIGAPRPGQAGARVPLPSGKGPTAPAAPRPAVGAAAAAPASEKSPPSSGRGVKPPSSPKPIANEPPVTNPRDSIPDSQKEDMATMAKSPEESLALFGLDAGGLTDAARAAVSPAKAPAAGSPPPSNRSPLASTNFSPNNKPLAPASSPGGPPPLPPSSQPQVPVPPQELPALHDRSEEEESTRAVSREEMLRGQDAVIIGEDSEGAHGEDATLALAPGFNEAAKLAEAYTKEHPDHPASPPPIDPSFAQPPFGPAPQGWQQPPPWQDPNAFPQGPQSYPGMQVGPVSGPHLPAQSWTPNPPQSQPQFPGGSVGPQSQPQLPVPQSGHMMAQPGMAAPNPGPIPYPGSSNIHQPPNRFGDWNANAPQKRPFKLSGQILLLGIVGVVCLAIFITGIVLFATTKF